MAALTWTIIIFSILGSIMMFLLFLANVLTTGSNPFVTWIQSVPPAEFLLVVVAFLILIAVLMRPRRRRR